MTVESNTTQKLWYGGGFKFLIMLSLISDEIIHRHSRCSFLHHWAIYQFICPILTKLLNIFQNSQKWFKVTVNYLFIKPTRKHLANRDSTTFYSFNFVIQPYAIFF